MRLPEHVRNLTAEEVECILDDLELLDAGYRLNLCIDPYEIFDFCIPVNPQSAERRDIDIIADDQAALYHAMYNWGRSPILVSEYRREMERLIRYFEHAVGEGYSRQNLVNALLAEAPEAPNTQDRTERLRALEQDFGVVLAVTMGIYSVGIDRLQELTRQRLRSSPEDAALGQEWASANDGGLKDVILNSLIEDLQRLLDKGDIDDADFARRKRSAETDATVISRLIRMNGRATAASRRGTTQSKDAGDGKDVFLYVSSAPRSRRIFGLPAIVAAQPQIHKRPFSMWRTRAQLFIYSLHNLTYNSYDHSLRPVDYLRRLKPIVEQTARFPHLSQCRMCVLNGFDGDRDCRFVKLCDMISSLDYGITTARKSMRNLALVKSLENYERFREAKPKTKEETTYVEFFRQLFEGRVQDVVLDRIRELQRMVLIKWEFSENMAAMVSYSDGREMIQKTHVDQVTNPIQALPIHLRLNSEEHRTILGAVMSFHEKPNVQAAIDLDTAYKMFVELDKQDTSFRVEHEVVRCFLYMACITVSDNELLRMSGNDLALRHADGIEKENKKLDKADLWYIKAWALRRSGRYPEGDELLTRAIRRYPRDPRMWHGRCLNSASWFQDREKTPFPHKLARAVDDATRAIKLYEMEGERGAVEQCAVNWNNIAYLRSFEPAHPVFNLRSARIALKRLKEVLPREKWAPSYPEFFHTEANLEYREYLAARANPRSTTDLVVKLANALSAIQNALDVGKKRRYEELKENIERALDMEREREPGRLANVATRGARRRRGTDRR